LATVRPWVEGEKIPDERVRDIFRQPPGVPTTFYRSSLVIGSRGVGKTTLFRYQKEIHEGIAVHISLHAELSSLTKQTGLGPLAFDYSPDLERLIIGKTVSLLAVSIVDRLIKKGLSIDRDVVADCLPSRFHHKSGSSEAQWISDMKRAIARGSLEEFDSVSETRPLPPLISLLGELAQQKEGPLLLLLDRADMILAPSLVPVLELLDQSAQYTALVAMRPTLIGQNVTNLADEIVAGDHYGVVHLGVSPRSREWVDFVEDSVRAQMQVLQFGSRFSSIHKEIKDKIIALSRDSVRSSLELFARYVAAKSESASEELLTALEDLRENQLAAAQRTLQKYHPDFRKLVSDIRAEALRQRGQITGPILLNITESARETLFSALARSSRLVEVALRAGALCMPDGQRWVPGLRPTELELPPLLVWQRGDTIWTADTVSTITIARDEQQILKKSGGSAKPPSIFVAYRMKSEESKSFRRTLEQALNSHPDLSRLLVNDGHVPAGTPSWAEAIRKRIQSAKAVVADVTGMRPDVLFELGFAYGLSKATIPVVSTSTGHANLPGWICGAQLGHYGDRSGIVGIVSGIAAQLSDPEFARVRRPPQPIPGLAVWLRCLDWNRHISDQFTTVAAREGLKVEVLPNNVFDESTIKRAASASLLVVSLDGTESDALMHFVCGAVVAKPRAGYGRTLSRVILVLQEPNMTGQNLIADSLRRCSDVVNVIEVNKVIDHTTRFGRKHNEWIEKASKRQPWRGLPSRRRRKR